MFKNKKTIWILAIILVLGSITVLAVTRQQANVEGGAEPATVTQLELSESVNASGELAAQPYAVLTWNTSGTVQDSQHQNWGQGQGR